MAKRKKSTFLRFIIVLAILLGIAYFAIPEVEVTRARKESVAYIAKETGYSPGLCNFLVGTKVGRKLCYVGLKRELKYYLRQAKKEAKKIKKELK